MNDESTIEEEALPDRSWLPDAEPIERTWTPELFRKVCREIRFDPAISHDILLQLCHKRLDGLDATGGAALWAWETGEDPDTPYLEELRGSYHDARAFVRDLTEWLDRVEPLIPLVEELGYMPPAPDVAALRSRAEYMASELGLRPAAAPCPPVPNPGGALDAPVLEAWTAERWRALLPQDGDDEPWIGSVHLDAMENLNGALWGIMEGWEAGKHTPANVEELRAAMLEAGAGVEKVLEVMRTAQAFLDEADRLGHDGPPIDEQALRKLAEEAGQARRQEKKSAGAGPWTARDWRAALEPFQRQYDALENATHEVDCMFGTATWLITGWEEGDYRAKHMDELREQYGKSSRAIADLRRAHRLIKLFLEEVDKRGAEPPPPDEKAAEVRAAMAVAAEKRLAETRPNTPAPPPTWTRESWRAELQPFTDRAEEMRGHIATLIDLNVGLELALVGWEGGAWSHDVTSSLLRTVERGHTAFVNLADLVGGAKALAAKLEMYGPVPVPKWQAEFKTGRES